eukprot:3844551-Prymnesium_polylepis.1
MESPLVHDGVNGTGQPAAKAAAAKDDTFHLHTSATVFPGGTVTASPCVQSAAPAHADIEANALSLSEHLAPPRRTSATSWRGGERAIDAVAASCTNVSGCPRPLSPP